MSTITTSLALALGALEHRFGVGSDYQVAHEPSYLLVGHGERQVQIYPQNEQGEWELELVHHKPIGTVRRKGFSTFDEVLLACRVQWFLDHGTELITKWDVVNVAEQIGLRTIQFTQWLGKDRGYGPGSCSGCGRSLPTEAHFAAHYPIYERRLFNLGWCPVRGTMGHPVYALR